MLKSLGGNRRRCWGYDFDWTSEHLTAEQMRPLIFSYDVLASEALDALDEISPPPQTKPTGSSDSDMPDGVREKPRRDLYAVLKDNADKDARLLALWEQVNAVPEWVDWEQIERGQAVFYRHAGPAVVALTFQSLLGGMGGRRVVETLARTGGFGVNVVRHRLLETFQHVLQVTRSLASVQPGGGGFASSVRVRLLHASVRRRIMQLVGSRPGYYSVDEYGVPVNDLDSIGTISTFSATLIWVGLPRQGIYLGRREVVDYLAFWRYVAYLVGAPDGFFSSPAKAKMIMESLLVSEVEPTETSKILANNILTGLHNEPPYYASRDFLCAQTYWLNGRDLARALAVQRPSPYYFALVAGQCIFFMFVSYAYQLVPSWEERKINKLRSLLYKLTVHDRRRGAMGSESVFDFKFVPDLETPATPLGPWRRATNPGQDRGQDGDGDAASPPPRRGVEGRNLASLLAAAAVAAALACAAAWLGLRGASAVSDGLFSA